MVAYGLPIAITVIALLGTAFSLTLYSAEAQSIPIPEFKPKAPEVQEAEPEPPRPTDFAMKVQLEPHENESARADGRYQVSNFAIAISNSSKLCPTGNCEFDLDGEMFGDLDLVYLDGKLRVNTSDSTKIMDLHASWQTIEERQQDGEPVQVLEGTLDVGNDPMNREYQSQTNGTIVSDGEDIILEAHGTVGSL